MTDHREPGPDIFEQALGLLPDDDANREPGAEEQEEAETETEELELSLDEGEETTESEPETYEVKAYGETVKLSLDELRDYAQKGLSLDKQQKKLLDEHNARLAEIAQEKTKIQTEAERLGELLEVFGQSDKAREHLDFLLENDLPEYRRQKAMLDEIATKSAELRQAKQQAEVAEGIELLSTTFPQEWADTKKRSELLTSAIDVFREVGIPETTTDGKVFVLAIKAARAAEKAAKYDALVDKAKAAQKTPPKKLPTATGITSKGGKTDEPLDVVAMAFPGLK